MATYATIWSNVAGLTYEQAKAAAAARGGRLITDVSNDPNASYVSAIRQWVYDEKTPSDDDKYMNLWVGAEITSDGWRWSDGTAIAKDRFQEETVNADNDPTNDVGPVISYAGTLYPLSQLPPDSPAFVSHGYVMDYMSSSVTGTESADYVLALGQNVSVKLLGGDDTIHYAITSGTIDLGSGQDQAFFDDQPGGLPLTIIDGGGSDTVSTVYGTIKASLDGDDDFELLALYGKVSYEKATQDISNESGYLSSAQIGNDNVQTQHLILGSGNDTVSGYDVITGGAGNDRLSAYVKAEGGKGNDTLIADAVAGGEDRVAIKLLGEDGNDTLIFRAKAEATGGAGADKFVFEAAVKATINDLGSTDRIDLSALLGDMSVSEARAGGYFTTSVSKGYTYGRFDADGGADGFTDLFTIKGVFSNIDQYII